MNVEAYLARIGLRPGESPTAATLAVLQRAHLYHVPYENLDILAGKRLSLDEEALFDKIVTRRRGGFCFELNELFGRLLRELGYEVTDCFGRFLRGEKEWPMRRHHVLIVTPPDGSGRWLCDVGVGSGSPTCPVLLREGVEQRQGGACYRMCRRPFLGWVLLEQKHGAWEDVYSFTEEPQLPADFLATCFYCERAEESIFNKAPMVSLRNPRGRRTLDGDEFRCFEGEEVRVHRAESPGEAATTLKEWFGL